MSKVEITINDNVYQIDKGEMLLSVLQGMGMQIPTLCYHKSLTPDGACRLCSVEITKESWKGWSQLVTSCLFPVEEGLIVKTHSDRVIKNRKTLLELYLAKSPDSRELLEIARNEGVDTTPYTIKAKTESNCIMCGLCTRVCKEYSTSAIDTLERGLEKFVGPSPDLVGEDCVGCSACADICPTSEIQGKYEDQKYKIWNKEFELPVCSVEVKSCRGCGVCEEVCPYSIPRVVLRKDGQKISKISQSDCIGCGLCAGSCPTGAISQKKIVSEYRPVTNFKGTTVTLACPRSPISKETENFELISCVGSVSVEKMLRLLAGGAASVVVMCRDNETCKNSLGKDLAEKRIAIVNRIASMCGLGSDRIKLIKPEKGYLGVKQTLEELKKEEEINPLKSVYKESSEDKGLDHALKLIDWLKNHDELEQNIPPRILDIFESEENKSNSLLYIDNTLELDLLLSLVMNELDLEESLQQLSVVLKEKNISVKPVFSQKQIEESDILRVIVFSNKDLPKFKKEVEIVLLHEVLDLEIPNQILDFSFKLKKKQKAMILQNVGQSFSKVDCSTPQEFAAYKMHLREGAWQEVVGNELNLNYLNNEDEVKDCMVEKRIDSHPILTDPKPEAALKFTFNGKTLLAKEGEMISSALFAAGIRTFGHHHRDEGAQGIYCANGQCSQCTVVADGRAVKSCMVPVKEGMAVESCEGHPELGEASSSRVTSDIPEINVPVLIVGAGPSGICAAIELGRLGINVLLIDDKQELGGKLSLQTHNFFGSVKDCYARTRGMDIGHILADEVQNLPTVEIWLNSTAVGVFSDKRVGIHRDGDFYYVTPERIMIASGAREKSLSFPGCDLPGAYGAGAFQTLVNRDLIKCADKLFIIGGGNVGLIGAYHALQAGIDVIGLVEALPRCGGYKVHEDKIKRLGVPVWTSHTVLRIEGDGKVERVVTAQIDKNFQPVKGTEKIFEVDTVLIAVGLSPVDELFEKAELYGIKTYIGGDAQEIAEASAAIFSGKITGRKIARDMGIKIPIPSSWESFGDILKHHPEAPAPLQLPDLKGTVIPIVRCVQEIPCNPCIEACPKGLITMKNTILDLPEFSGECLGCSECVNACPGLAISLFYNDYDPAGKKALVMLPFEFEDEMIPLGKIVDTTDMEGNIVGQGKVIAVRKRISQDRRKMIQIEVPYQDGSQVAGFIIREIVKGKPCGSDLREEEDPVVCRCERVRKSEIVKEIRAGVRDLNQLKATTRAGLGGCGGKTCTDLILRIYRSEGVPMEEIKLPTNRPLVSEIHLGDFVNKNNGEEN